MRLCDMKEGQTGIITRIGGNGVLRRRILEMGLLKGTEIYVEKYAPLRPVSFLGEAGPKGGIQYRFGIRAKNSGRPKNCSDPVSNRTDIH